MTHFLTRLFSRRSAVRDALLANKIAYADQLRQDLNALRAENEKLKHERNRAALEERKKWMPENARLRRVETAARNLHTFLWQNVGDNAEWPVEITIRGTNCDELDKALADDLTQRLQALKDALEQAGGRA